METYLTKWTNTMLMPNRKRKLFKHKKRKDGFLNCFQLFRLCLSSIGDLLKLFCGGGFMSRPDTKRAVAIPLFTRRADLQPYVWTRYLKIKVHHYEFGKNLQEIFLLLV